MLSCGNVLVQEYVIHCKCFFNLSKIPCICFHNCCVWSAKYNPFSSFIVLCKRHFEGCWRYTKMISLLLWLDYGLFEATSTTLKVISLLSTDEIILVVGVVRCKFPKFVDVFNKYYLVCRDVYLYNLDRLFAVSLNSFRKLSGDIIFYLGRHANKKFALIPCWCINLIDE